MKINNVLKEHGLNNSKYKKNDIVDISNFYSLFNKGSIKEIIKKKSINMGDIIRIDRVKKIDEYIYILYAQNYVMNKEQHDTDNYIRKINMNGDVICDIQLESLFHLDDFFIINDSIIYTCGEKIFFCNNEGKKKVFIDNNGKIIYNNDKYIVTKTGSVYNEEGYELSSIDVSTRDSKSPTASQIMGIYDDNIYVYKNLDNGYNRFLKYNIKTGVKESDFSCYYIDLNGAGIDNNISADLRNGCNVRIDDNEIIHIVTFSSDSTNYYIKLDFDKLSKQYNNEQIPHIESKKSVNFCHAKNQILFNNNFGFFYINDNKQYNFHNETEIINSFKHSMYEKNYDYGYNKRFKAYNTGSYIDINEKSFSIYDIRGELSAIQLL